MSGADQAERCTLADSFRTFKAGGADRCRLASEAELHGHPWFEAEPRGELNTDERELIPTAKCFAPPNEPDHAPTPALLHLTEGGAKHVNVNLLRYFSEPNAGQNIACGNSREPLV